jgi:hypothetical protein
MMPGISVAPEPSIAGIPGGSVTFGATAAIRPLITTTVAVGITREPSNTRTPVMAKESETGEGAAEATAGSRARMKAVNVKRKMVFMRGFLSFLMRPWVVTAHQEKTPQWHRREAPALFLCPPVFQPAR